MSTKRIIKVFCSGDEQKQLVGTHEVIERYPGFVLLHSSPGQASRLGKRLPIEDITDQYTIRIGARVIDTSRPRIDKAGRTQRHPAYTQARKLPSGPHHYLVQLNGPVKKAWLSRLRKVGAEPRAPFDNFAYVVRLDRKALAAVAQLPFVRWVGHLSHRDRVHVPVTGAGGEAMSLPRTRALPNVLVVEFFGMADLRAAVAAVRRAGGKVLSRSDTARTLTVEVPSAAAQRRRTIERLSAVHGVSAIRQRTVKRTTNDVAAGIMGAPAAWANDQWLTGAGETVCVCDTGLDTGDPEQIHPDFEGRIVGIKSFPITAYFSPYIRNPRGDDGPADVDSGHGTHVAGSVLGSGRASRDTPGLTTPIRGLAYEARLVFQAIEQELDWKDWRDEHYFGRYLLAGIPDDLTELFSHAYRKGARIHTNSWGGGAPGEYDAQCYQLDEFVWKHKDFCVLFAAGNDGTDADGDGRINLTSVTSPGTAKNCITVGATESKRLQFNGERYGDWWPDDYPVNPIKRDAMADEPDTVVAFSSRGPTEDRRIKPDVVAPGTFILSTRSRRLAVNNFAWGRFVPNTHYFYMGGTSMATPLTAGAVALLRQWLRDYVGYVNPSAALLKAALILGTTRLPRCSRDGQVSENAQGFGRIALESIVAARRPAQVVFIDDPRGIETGQVTEFAIDVHSNRVPFRMVMAYTDYPGPRLVNNLNLMLIAPDGRVHVGNQRGATDLTSDACNNVEMIHIDRPPRGKWTLRVIGSNVPQRAQDYAIAYRVDGF